ncbi:MAG: LysM peptidoglycan-binding domain-containing protein [Syntrophaceae bacterium]|nr:LysM peptidoglycan-binding domain-containing protein [Syntrophaceae bacterium]
MSPRMLRLTLVSTALAAFGLLSIPSTVLSQEDTAHLVLRKKAAAKDGPSVYVVQKGDSLSRIIRRKLGRQAAGSASVRRQVMKLNPQIRNPDRIYPGQRIALPRLGDAPGGPTHVVNKGDTLSQILHDRLGIAAGEMAAWIRLVMQLNPGLSDPDRIYPGQALLLPRKDRAPDVPAVQPAAPQAEGAAVQTAAAAFQPTDRELAVIAAVVRRTGGDLLRSGKYFVPLTETEHLVVDCADIPMAELGDGSRIFLDFGRRIPDEAAALLRARWGNFTVLHEPGTDGLFSVLEGIFGASAQYAFRRPAEPLMLGTTAGIGLRPDRVLVRRPADGGEQVLAVIFRASAQTPTIPEPVARYAEGKGISLLEIDGGSGSLRERQAAPAPAGPTVLQGGGNRAFVGSLLEALGYTYKTDQPIPLPEAAQQRDPPVLRADYVVRIGTRTAVIQFGETATPAQVKLCEGGMDLIQVAGSDERKTVVEKVLRGLEVPYAAEIEEFRPPGEGEPPRWLLTLSAFRVTTAGGTLYLVADDADRGICAYIGERWARRIALY